MKIYSKVFQAEYFHIPKKKQPEWNAEQKLEKTNPKMSLHQG